MQVATQFEPHDHVVQFYADETFLADVVADYLRAGAAAGERLLVLLTAPHLAAVLQRLEAAGLDTGAAMSSGQLEAYDADLILETIMRDGMPVEALFERHLLAGIEAASPVPTRAFGELVNLLCARGNAEAAVRLEALWHAACHRLPMTLLCGYALQHFDRPEDQAAFDAICDHHSHVLPAEHYNRLESRQQLREVSRLQQQVQALHHERASRRQAEQNLAAVQELCGEMLMELADHALHDGVTGLTNRRHAQQRLAELIADLPGQRGRVAVLHVDIDQLQAINESLGLEMGDYYLHETAQRIKRCLGGSGIVSRLGSDEMMAVLPGIEPLDEVLKVVERLLDWTSKPVELGGHKVVASCCIGISLFPEHGRTVDELMRHANRARRHAQRLGRRRYHVFTPELRDDDFDRLALRSELREALPLGELELYYLPTLSARSGQVVAISAQPRWQSSRFGTMESARWMSVAEEAGQAAIIGQWVLARACRHAKAWIEAGLDLRVAVQVSTAELLDGEIVDRVGEILDHSGLPGEMLELELSESGLMRAPQRAAAMLERLKALGVRLTVDEFGSGHSILGHLNRFPIDTIKIHKPFIAGCLDTPHHQAIIGSMIGMAHQLGQQVIAGGVATRGQADYLRQQGCDLLRGPLWSRMEYRDVPDEEAPE
ncbi:EAL domain-containing protein [Halomonas sp. EGI 63088]|uniref:EAL domain-containing protein n=1 Tax=Halomonas flagellata TaxID=2920385 RepID=A0ABS9RXH7_9GAMM|nr:EAL domain-containing protein [Halomonas flagellata]MCH4564558.1 EAL domain-containing protein [Halomonas flagellata]